MAITPILTKREIQNFESYYFNLNKYETVTKILKITALFFGVAAINCLSPQNPSEFSIGSIIFSSAISLTSFVSLNILNFFQSPIKKPDKITPASLLKSLRNYNSKIPSLDQKTYYGKIEKIDLRPGSKLILKADLHGEYLSLIELLKALQNKGYLDENFNVQEEHKGKILIAFLGDYLDRGEHSFEIINALIKLKINNPGEILLIKGNHENLSISKFYIHENEKHFYENEELCGELETFFSTLPLTAFVGAKQPHNNEVQYVLLAHGAIEPDIDLYELLQTETNKAIIYISKDKKVGLSKRILDLLPENFKNQNIGEIQNTKKALEDYIRAQTLENLEKLNKLLEISNINKKKAKQILSILRIQEFFQKTFRLPTKTGPLSEEFSIIEWIEHYREDKDSTSFTWGDIIKNIEDLGLNPIRKAGLRLTPEFIKDYFRVISSETKKVKALRAGHAHSYNKFSLNGKKVGFIETLPVTGESTLYDPIRRPIDVAQIITLSSHKIKHWTQSFLLRKRKSMVTTQSPEKCFYH